MNFKAVISHATAAAGYRFAIFSQLLRFFIHEDNHG